MQAEVGLNLFLSQMSHWKFQLIPPPDRTITLQQQRYDIYPQENIDDSFKSIYWQIFHTCRGKVKKKASEYEREQHQKPSAFIK